MTPVTVCTVTGLNVTPDRGTGVPRGPVRVRTHSVVVQDVADDVPTTSVLGVCLQVLKTSVNPKPLRADVVAGSIRGDGKVDSFNPTIGIFARGITNDTGSGGVPVVTLLLKPVVHTSVSLSDNFVTDQD